MFSMKRLLRVEFAVQSGVTNQLNRLGLRGNTKLKEEAIRAGEAVAKSERALGQVILTAGYNGEIKVRLHYYP